MASFSNTEKNSLSKMSDEELFNDIVLPLHDIAEYLYTGDGDHLEDAKKKLQTINKKIVTKNDRERYAKAFCIYARALAKKSKPNLDWEKSLPHKKEFCICGHP